MNEKTNVVFYIIQITIAIFILSSLNAYAQKDTICLQLQQAVFDNDIKTIDSLSRLDSFDVNCSAYGNEPPLIYAIDKEYTEIFDLLIQLGADVHYKGFSYDSPLATAIMNENDYMVEQLILYGADLNKRENRGTFPLHIAAIYGNYLIADMLLHYGAKVNTYMRDSSNALHTTAIYNDTAIAELLILNGIDINHRNKKGHTAMLLAASMGSLEIVDLLYRYGADPFIKDKKGDDALSHAILAGNNDIAEYLINCCVDLKSDTTEKIIQYAMINSNYTVLRLLKQKGVKPLRKPFISAVEMGYAVPFNSEDALSSYYFGVSEGKYDIDMYLGFEHRFRAEYYKIRVKDNANHFYQFKTRRNYLFLGVDKRFNLYRGTEMGSAGLFAGVKTGYSYGRFIGSEIRPESKWMFAYRAGVYAYDGFWGCKLYYQYKNFPDPVGSPHWFGIQLNLRITGEAYYMNNTSIPSDIRSYYYY